MQLRYRTRDTSIVNALPTSAQCTQVSSTLAEKLAAQIQWMQKKGIDICLKESERPRLDQRPALPGTVIHFRVFPE
jgi:hypothetical protein